MKRAGAWPALFIEASSVIVTLAPVVVVAVVVILVAVDLMREHANAAIVAAADPGTCAPESIVGGPCGIAAVAHPVARHAFRRRLWDKDQVALGIRRHRVRARGLRNGLDQHARSVDH